ncbi:uncharacterized protein LOC115926484 [Strongylocentrotus purpuratus]|uniref:Death domain-containing protein n=1 Tax=Strongylocentrotus purpuratus TaxID=7668 RepID=A0A7M7PCD0_STRPU|nr:uncharacterized protein LOC115926484 [Strongylocentrotus purpuratus]
METEPYHFAAGGSNTATSSSSEAGVQVGLKRLTTIHDPPQEHPMKGNTGGISDSSLEKLTKALMVDDYSARSLGLELGFIRTEVYQYCGYGKPKESSGILRMLRAWKRKTPEANETSGLLEALKKANLKHLADDLQEAPSTSTTKKTEPVSYGRSNTAPSSSSEADVQVGRKQSATIDDQPPLQNPMKDYTDKVPARKSHIPDLVNKVGRVYHMVFTVAKKKFEKQSKVLG